MYLYVYLCILGAWVKSIIYYFSISFHEFIINSTKVHRFIGYGAQNI